MSVSAEFSIKFCFIFFYTFRNILSIVYASFLFFASNDGAPNDAKKKSSVRARSALLFLRNEKKLQTYMGSARRRAGRSRSRVREKPSSGEEQKRIVHLWQVDENGKLKGAQRALEGSNMLTTKKSTCYGVISALKSVVLPVGYPDSVAPEYITFQIFDTIQEACGYFRGLLNSQAFLTGLGVGDASISPVGAVVITLILAYPAMVSGLLVGSFPKLVSSFGKRQKQYQVFKEFLDLLGNTLSLIAPAYSHNEFLALACIGAAITAVASVIGSVSRSPLIAHLALENNFGDCAAKESNQSRLLKLILIFAGFKFLLWVNTKNSFVYIAFATLSIFKIYFLALSMKTLSLRTFNEQRLFIALRSWQRDRRWKVPSPKDVSLKESLFYTSSGIHVAYSPDKVSREVSSLTKRQLADLVKAHEKVGAKYLTLSKDVLLLPRDQKLAIRDQLMAYMHIHRLRVVDESAWKALEFAAEHVDDFMKQANANGWTTEHALLL